MKRMLFAGVVGLVALSNTGHAAPVDVISDNADLAIYLKKFPLLPAETTAYMKAGSGTTLWASLGTNGSTQDVIFESSKVVSASNGFANIKYDKDDANKEFQNLSITLPGLQFGDILFDTQKADAFTVSVFSDAFSLLNPFGSYSFTGLGNGTQSFAILATGPYSITRVLLEAIAPEGFAQIKHFQFSEIQANTGGCRPGPCEAEVEAVPIPAALPLLGGALLMLGWLGRSRRRLLDGEKRGDVACLKNSST